MKFLGERKDRVEMGNSSVVYGRKCNEWVDEELGTFRGKSKDFREKKKGWLTIDYPFKKVLEFEVTYRTFHQLIDEIRKAFRYIYENEELCNEYWHDFHDIGDFCIEHILIDKDDRIVVLVGS